MTWTIEKEFVFDSAHYLPHVPRRHKCRRVHGHTYKLIVRLSCSKLSVGNERGMVYEYGKLADLVTPLVKELDHQTLNDLPGLENPTTEVLARWAFNRLRPVLPFLQAVIVHESSTTRCEYSE